MQPERIQGKDYSIRSDVWSTGITLLELVQNRFPFPPDLPPIELMMYITNQEVSITGVEWCYC
jgi:mitogen-activated protein kinase kinase